MTKGMKGVCVSTIGTHLPCGVSISGHSHREFDFKIKLHLKRCLDCKDKYFPESFSEEYTCIDSVKRGKVRLERKILVGNR